MTRVVIDASVLFKLFVDEDLSDEARALVAQAGELLAPDLILAEIANVTWKRQARRDIDSSTAQAIVDNVLRFPLQITRSDAILADALQIAMTGRCTVYDALYVAVAQRHSTTLMTGDKKLARLMAPSVWGKLVTWIGDPT